MSHLQGRSGAYYGSVSGIEDRGEGGREGGDEGNADRIIIPSDVWQPAGRIVLCSH